jgi:NAD(P)-dependent dehydrogenase (short-subunit alcohol dehydrogenase family)
MNRKVKDKIAVVTGGSAGIGLGTAERFSAEAARAFIIEALRYSQPLDKLVEHTRNRATSTPLASSIWRCRRKSAQMGLLAALLMTTLLAGGCAYNTAHDRRGIHTGYYTDETNEQLNRIIEWPSYTD